MLDVQAGSWKKEVLEILRQIYAGYFIASKNFRRISLYADLHPYLLIPFIPNNSTITPIHAHIWLKGEDFPEIR